MTTHTFDNTSARFRLSNISAALILGLSLTACGSDNTVNVTPTPAPDTPSGVQAPSFNEDYLNRDIRDDIFYFVMLDRFNNGDSSNDEGAADMPLSSGGFDASNKGYYHGGDLKGIQDKLDYIKTLGATAIWLTPILRNQAVQGDSAGYHGYWTLDFTQVDPHFGANDDLKAFIDAAHSKGLKVFFDIITNHTADVIRYEECHNPDGSHIDGDSCTYKSLAQLAANDTYTPFLPAGTEDAKSPAWLNDTANYHNQGDSTFSGENSLNGDFFGLDDLNTESDAVVQGMIDAYKHIITEFKPDGFRIDTVKHVNIEFWQQFSPAIQTHARDAGIPQFELFGEVFESSPAFLSRYTSEGNIPSVLDFNLKSTASAVFSGQLSAASLAQIFETDDWFNDADSRAEKLMNFISNHDEGRLGHLLNQQLTDASDTEKRQRIALAHAFMMFARGVPVIYYGDEQGFNGDGGDKDAREDMMPSSVADYNDNDLFGTDKTTADDNFDMTHPLYVNFNEYAHVYQAHNALRHGVHINRASDNEHVYAFSRVDVDAPRDHLVLFNPTAQTQTATVTAAADEYTAVFVSGVAEPTDMSATDGNVMVDVPAFGVAIYRANDALPTVTDLQVNMAGIDAGAIAAGTVNLTYDVNTSATDFVRVRTEVKVGEGEYQLVSDDYTAPYTSRLDVSQMENGSTIAIRVSANNLASSDALNVMQSREVLVENRLPSRVQLTYQNDNQREWVYAMDARGSTQGPFRYQAGMTHIQWPSDSSTLTLFFCDQMTADAQQYFEYDKPVTLTREAVVSLSTESEQQTLVADLFINALGNVNNQDNRVSQAPETISVAAADLAPIADTDQDGDMNNNLYVRGAINGWGVDDPMQYLGFSTYHRAILVNKGDAEFKFADANWSPTNIGAPITQYGLTAAANPGNLNHHFPVTGLYDFYVQQVALASDSGEQVFTLPLVKKNHGPAASEIFVRGSMNEWSANAEQRLSYQGLNLDGAHLYEGEFTLTPGNYEFKIANADWSFDKTTSDATHPQVELDTAEPIGDGAGASNMQLSVATEGSFRFKLTATTSDTPQYALTVTQTSTVGEDLPPLAADIYLKGELDGWGDGVVFSYIGNKQYSATVYADDALFASQANQNDDALWDFKIADLNWSLINLGGPTQPDVGLDTPLLLNNDNNSSNLALSRPSAGLYTFTLDAADASAYKLTINYSAAQQVMFHYYRADADYADWGLHVWGDELHPYIANRVTWTTPLTWTGNDDFGAKTALYVSGTSVPVGLIVHKGDEKDPGPDMSIDTSLGLSFWMNSGDQQLYLSEAEARANQ